MRQGKNVLIVLNNHKDRLIMRLFFVFSIAILSCFLIGCPGKPYPRTAATESVSNSEIAEAVASGLVTTSSASLQQARYLPHKTETMIAEMVGELFNSKAYAAVSNGLCATLQQSTVGLVAPTSTCVINTPVGDNSVSLVWTPCNLNAPFGTWSGGEILRLNSSSTTSLSTACTSYPTFQAGDVVQRVFFIPTSRIANDDINLSPVTVLVDTSGNYGPNPPTTGWYHPINAVGEHINYTGGGARNLYVDGIHLTGEIDGYIVWDFTVSSGNPLNYPATLNPVVVNGGNTITSGILYVQDNLNKNVTQTDLTGVAYGSSQCGVPTSGTATTSVLSGSYAATETLAFSATCQQATLSTPSAHTITLLHSF